MSRLIASTIALVAVAVIGGCPQSPGGSGDPNDQTPTGPQQYTIATAVTGNGSVEKSAESDSVDEGTTVVLRAIPDSGSQFDHWEGDASGTDALISITVNANIAVTAVFVPSDVDGDGVPDSEDNCPVTANADQADTDNDGVGDACSADLDFDDDGVPDSADNCPFTPNSDQADSDGDGVGDACSFVPDTDDDGVPDSQDNCPFIANADQADGDGDGVGDACAWLYDADEDGVWDDDDNCPFTPNPDQTDSDGDGVGDACESGSGTTLTISHNYGNEVLELSDGSVWDIANLLPWQWDAGDRVIVVERPSTFYGIINLDEGDVELLAAYLGQAIIYDRIYTVSGDGEFLQLDLGTLWQIDSLDRWRVLTWLMSQYVVVAQETTTHFNIIRGTDGAVVGATYVGS